MGDSPHLGINISLDIYTKCLCNSNAHKDVSSLHLYDGEDKLLIGEPGKDMSLVRSYYLNWSVGTSIEQPGAAAWASAISMWWIVFGLCAVLMGTLAIVFISFKHARPIDEISRQIVNYVDQAFGKRKKSQNDDFQFIQSAVEHLIKDSSDSRQYMQENIHFRRQKLFQELLNTGDAPTKPRWAQELRELGQAGDYDEISVFVTEIDHYGEFGDKYRERDRDLLKFAIGSALKEVFENRGIETWTSWIAPQQLAAMAFLKGAQSAELQRCWRELQHWIGHNLKLTVTVGTAESFGDAGTMHVAFKKAIEALDYKSVYGSNAVIAYETIETKGKGELFEHLLIIRSIGLSFKEGDAKWESTAATLIDMMKTRAYSRTSIANLLQYLIYQLYKELGEWSGEGEDPVLQLSRSADAIETIEDVEGPFLAALKEAYVRIHELRGMQSGKRMIHEARAYIEKNFADPNMSLTMLSEKFDTHASYLSRLFKEEYQENFVDMLARVRIERAKEMLAGSDASLQEIAVQVGYSHYFSFSRVFKKLEKIPVSQYRKMLESQSDHDF